MLDTLRTATHVLRTSETDVQVISFNSRNDVIGRFTYARRQDAIRALERMTGHKVSLKPMQTASSEKVETQQELSDIEFPDE